MNLHNSEVGEPGDDAKGGGGVEGGRYRTTSSPRSLLPAPGTSSARPTPHNAPPPSSRPPLSAAVPAVVPAAVIPVVSAAAAAAAATAAAAASLSSYALSTDNIDANDTADDDAANDFTDDAASIPEDGVTRAVRLRIRTAMRLDPCDKV